MEIIQPEQWDLDRLNTGIVDVVLRNLLPEAEATAQ